MHYLLVFMLVLLAPLSWAETVIVDESCNNKYGAKLVSLQGKLLYDPDRKGHWQTARLHQMLCEGSGIRVEANSRASLRLSNGIVLRLHEGTNATLDAISPEQATFLHLLKGFVHFISRTPRLLKISTPIANAGPEGTEFAMSVDDTNASLWVYEGDVKFFNDKGSIHLSPGQGAQAKLGQAPQAKVDIKPQDAVNWALYYPPVLPYPKATDSIDPDIRTAIQGFRQGHIDVALARLDALPKEKQTPYFYKVRAAMRLTVGQDKLALRDIQELLSNNPNDAEALALQSVRALTQNRKDEAYALANKAVAANPQSASAYSALSYAEQGRFQLDKAQAAADQAVKLAPHDAMVWARKAELELSQGLTSGSQHTAQKAIAADANLERTQTVLGFSYLLRADTDAALETFNKAIQFDSTSPLARLGLGLAKIRNGDLEQGREDLETAAILDPSNSIVRSYLGKAYYEERRDALAEDQFKLAKQRDPKDPTPYFYDAIKKQTENRPIEALKDLQKSIELNDNREVYRSKLLLDSDLASRSASLSRIYNNLGFTQVALVEGWKSINFNPTNYSAHRLLADSYSIRPSYEIARVSELLQSQLLQPINMTPIQPQLGDKSLLTIQGSGPSSLSFNEFNPIFTRNGFSFQSSGMVGNNETYGDEIVHSGLWQNSSYSIGQFHYETEGFRQNNDVDVDLINGFIQAELTPNFSIQAEIRHKTTDRGDIDLNADGTHDKNFRIGSDINTYRAGLHYSISKSSDLIASYIYTDGEGRSIISNPSDQGDSPGPFSLPGTFFNGNQGEVQHLFRSTWLSNVTGFGYTRSDLSPVIPTKIIQTNEHANAYSYNYIHYPKNVDWTVGVSIDSIDQTENTQGFNVVKSKRVNPKLGMLWRPSFDTTIRMAMTRTTKGSLIPNRTIEPTQVAGFNQFYEDDLFTDSWLYGAGLDHKFSSDLYGGIEVNARDLYTPVEIKDQDNNIIGNRRVWHEQNYRSYLNWNLTTHLSANFSFHLEEFDGDSRFSVAHLVPLSNTTYDGKAGLRFFDPSGFFCNLEAEYVNQRTYWPDGFENNPVRHNEFVLFNAGLGYRLPRRLGIIQLDVNNIFNRDFNFQSHGGRSPQAGNADGGQAPPFIPDRTIFARFTLSL